MSEVRRALDGPDYLLLIKSEARALVGLDPVWVLIPSGLGVGLGYGWNLLG